MYKQQLLGDKVNTAKGPTIITNSNNRATCRSVDKVWVKLGQIIVYGVKLGEIHGYSHITT